LSVILRRFVQLPSQKSSTHRRYISASKGTLNLGGITMFHPSDLFKHLVRKRLVFLCAGLSLTIALFLVSGLAQKREVQPRPGQSRIAPLDPLTPEEIELATRIANQDARVKEALGGGRTQLIQIEFLALKSGDYREAKQPEELKVGRHAAVIFYRYDQDLGIHAIVDLEKNSVDQVTKLEGRVIPLGAAEVAEAFNLALRNERVIQLLGARIKEFRVAGLAGNERPENRVEGLRMVAASPRDPCYKHRCLDLIFHQREGYLAGTEVTVDLTAQTVRVERTGR
jgi:hypothetical protein